MQDEGNHPTSIVWDDRNWQPILWNWAIYKQDDLKRRHSGEKDKELPFWREEKRPNVLTDKYFYRINTI